MSDRGTSQERDTRFSGYGDRVGSGVELAPARWTGGEVVTDPTIMQKSLKPRRMFYSPIGDGVVAADGVEMKYVPAPREPRVTVIQQCYTERAPPGRPTVRVIEKLWSEGGPGGGVDENAQAAGQYGGGPGSAQNGLGGMPNSSVPQQQQQQQQQPVQPPAPAMAPPQQPKAAAPLPSYDQLDDPLGLHAAKPNYLSQPQTAKEAPPSSAQPKYGSAMTQPPTVNTGYGAGGGRGTPSNYSAATSPLGGGYGGGGPRSFTPETTASLFSDPGMRYDIKKEYLVSNPRELIHQYATTTPINTIPGVETISTTQYTKEEYHSTVEETFGPYPPYTARHGVPNPHKFVRQLRDETMTSTQRQANQNQQSFVRDGGADPAKVEEIRRQAKFSPNSGGEIDSLTNRLISGLQVAGSGPYYKH